MGFNTFPCNPYPISTEELNKGNNDDINIRVAALESYVSDLNSNKANQITIAPFFNAETAYTAGDLVYYNGLSYRCTNDHEGAWDADDFAATTIDNELDSLKSGLNNLITSVTGTKAEATYQPSVSAYASYTCPSGYAPIGVALTGGDSANQFLAGLSGDNVVRFINTSTLAVTTELSYKVYCIKDSI